MPWSSCTGPGLGDALAGLLVYVMGVMGYYYLMVNLFPIAQAALATAIQWGLAGTGGTIPHCRDDPEALLYHDGRAEGRLSHGRPSLLV